MAMRGGRLISPGAKCETPLEEWRQDNGNADACVNGFGRWHIMSECSGGDGGSGYLGSNGCDGGGSSGGSGGGNIAPVVA